MRKIGVFALSAVLLAAAQGALAAGDPKKGQRVFNKCKACHSLVAGQRRIGPTLYGMFGREAGTLDGFSFSSAMKKSKVVWTEKTLDQYLAKPREFMPGNKMAFPGLTKKEERDDVIAYLKEAAKPK
jgi:cytochrome c